MKKLSMLAAGVAVLSMCACTEANEFTPSTNGNTKKITEIKVASNPSALGTRTVFDTSEEKYGVVTWEEGVDQIYFYKNATNPQIFTCGEDATGPKLNYDWNLFIADDAGLDVGSTYYVNNKPSGYDYKDSRGVPCDAFTVPNDLKHGVEGCEEKVLQQFMKNYDLLMSNSSVTATETMDYIFMDHAFSLIAVDLKCTNPGNFKDNTQKPLFYETDLSVKNSESANCFCTTFKNDYNGKLVFTSASSNTYVASKLLDEPTELLVEPTDDWVLDESANRKKITFYLLLHSSEPVSELVFLFGTQDREGGASNTTDKTVTITLKNPFTFELGNVYRFGFGVDYQPSGIMGHTYNEELFNFKLDWKEFNGGQIKLCSKPDDMEVESVTTNTPS